MIAQAIAASAGTVSGPSEIVPRDEQSHSVSGSSKLAVPSPTPSALPLTATLHGSPIGVLVLAALPVLVLVVAVSLLARRRRGD